MKLVDVRERMKALGVEIPEDARPVYKGVAKSPVVDRANRLVKGIVSSPRVDMDGEVVLQNYDLRYFEPVRTVYWNHQYARIEDAIATCRVYGFRPEGMYATTYVTKNAIGDDVLTLIEEEIVRGFSVGVIPLDQGRPTADEVEVHGPCANIIRRSVFLEYSILPMPSNPDAMIGDVDRVLTKGLIRRTTAVQLGLVDAGRTIHPAATADARKKCVIRPERKVCTIRA